MKRLILPCILLASLCATSQSYGQDSPIPVQGIGNVRCIVVINNSSAFEPTSPYIQWALGFVSGAHASVLEIALADGAVIDQQTADQAAIAASRIARRGETRISIDVRDKCEKDPSLKLADAVKSAMEDWFD